MSIDDWMDFLARTYKEKVDEQVVTGILGDEKFKVGDKVEFKDAYTGTEYTVLAEHSTAQGQYLFLDAPVNGRPASVKANRVRKVKLQFKKGEIWAPYQGSNHRYHVVEVDPSGNRAAVFHYETTWLGEKILQAKTIEGPTAYYKVSG